MSGSLAPIIEPGFWSSQPVHVALTVCGLVALVSGVVGTFTIIRGQSFAGHSLSDIGTSGGAAAVLVGTNTLYGFITFNVLAAGVMEMIGLRHPRGRDVATGIVLGASLGLAGLFLYWDTTSTSTTGATVNVLFGSAFTLSNSVVPVVAALAVASVALCLILYRPLILSSLSPDLAAARGVRVRLVGVAYLLALALAVSLSALTIGAVLSTALLVGPAATALRLTKRTGPGMALSVVIGLVATAVGVLLAYDSADWSSSGQGWPVSFCIVAVIFVAFLASRVRWRRRR